MQPSYHCTPVASKISFMMYKVPLQQGTCCKAIWHAPMQHLQLCMQAVSACMQAWQAYIVACHACDYMDTPFIGGSDPVQWLAANFCQAIRKVDYLSGPMWCVTAMNRRGACRGASEWWRGQAGVCVGPGEDSGAWCCARAWPGETGRQIHSSAGL